MWAELAHAMAEHLKLKLDVYMVITGSDWHDEAELQRRVIDAEGRHEAARAVIRQHQVSEHG